MAKARKLPATGRKRKRTVPEVLKNPEPTPVPDPAEPKLPGIRVVPIEIPLGDICPERYVTRHAEARFSYAQGRVLDSLGKGLRRTDARLESGRYVSSAADVFRFLLEEIGRAGTVVL